MTIQISRRKFLSSTAATGAGIIAMPESYFLGPDQLAWLKRGLLNSRATWKVIASDMPLSIIVYDDALDKKGFA